MKRTIVSALAHLCTAVDFLIIDRLPERIQLYWNHPPVLLSIELDDKWKTGVWNEPSA